MAFPLQEAIDVSGKGKSYEVKLNVFIYKPFGKSRHKEDGNIEMGLKE
jgi:hypothetical protein